MNLADVNDLDPWELHNRQALAAFNGEMGAELVILRCRSREGRCAKDLAIIRSTGLGPLFVAYDWPTNPKADPEARQHEIDWSADTAPPASWVKWIYTRAIPPPEGTMRSEFQSFEGEPGRRLELLAFAWPAAATPVRLRTVCRRHGAASPDRAQVLEASTVAQRSWKCQTVWIPAAAAPVR